VASVPDSVILHLNRGARFRVLQWPAASEHTMVQTRGCGKYLADVRFGSETLHAIGVRCLRDLRLPPCHLRGRLASSLGALAQGLPLWCRASRLTTRSNSASAKGRRSASPLRKLTFCRPRVYRFRSAMANGASVRPKVSLGHSGSSVLL